MLILLKVEVAQVLVDLFNFGIQFGSLLVSI